MRSFSKHYSKCKAVSIKVRKLLQERRLPIVKFWQHNPQNNFLNFLTPKNIFITLQYTRDIFGIFLKHTFVECSSNILETLLRNFRNLRKDQHLLLSNHTLLTEKQLFHRELFQKSFALKCFLNVPWISKLLQRWWNTQGIFPKYYMPAGDVPSKVLLYTWSPVAFLLWGSIDFLSLSLSL